MGRIFAGYANHLMWSEANNIGSFPKDNDTVVSGLGDEVKAIVTYFPSIVIVNRDSVYEMSGSQFDNPNADWSLYRTGCKHGKHQRHEQRLRLLIRSIVRL